MPAGKPGSQSAHEKRRRDLSADGLHPCKGAGGFKGSGEGSITTVARAVRAGIGVRSFTFHAAAIMLEFESPLGAVEDIVVGVVWLPVPDVGGIHSQPEGISALWNTAEHIFGVLAKGAV